MRIQNIRLGFATNSSSTHSIVFLPKGTQVEDDCQGFDFGWDYFTATDRRSKLGYMAIILAKNLSDIVNISQASFITQSLLGKAALEAIRDGDIDHQSVPVLPRDFKGQMINLEFAQELSRYIIDNDSIAILGGNDDDEYTHPLSGLGKELDLNLPYDSKGTPLVCKKSLPGQWVIYNRDTGAKVRLSFNDQLDPNAKAKGPELADVKITDWCDMNCQYCTIESTEITIPNGKKKISEIEVGDLVLTRDPNQKDNQWESVSAVMQRDYEGQLIEIQLEDGSILELTPEHEVFTTNRGWITAKEIEESDDLINV